MRRIEPDDKCEVQGCNHDATDIWVGDGGPLAITRSYMQFKWCDCCITKKQLEHAKKQVLRIAALEAKLAQPCGGEPAQERVEGEQ